MKNVEVEIQAFIKDPKKAERKLRKVGKFVRTRKQTDTYYVPPQRDFFKKEPPVEYLIDKTKKACSDFLDSLGIDYEAKRQMGYPRMLYRKFQKAPT